jgi:hypothetical protein
MVELDIWIEKVQRAEYLAEDELKALCEYVRALLVWHLIYFFPTKTKAMLFTPFFPFCRSQVKEVLVEESNVQPVNSPVTVSFLGHT